MRLPYIYAPLLFTVTLCVVGVIVLAYFEDLVQNPFSRADVGDACNFEFRGQHDTSWLRCEDSTYWPAAHITQPLGITLLLGGTWVPLAIPFAWESFEALLLTFFKSFVIFPTDLEQQESAGGALIGDALINGTMGVILGLLLMRLTRFPGILPFILRNRDYGVQVVSRRYVSQKVARKYAFMFVLHAVAHVFPGLRTDELAYGGLITYALVPFLVLFVFPRLIDRHDVEGVDMSRAYARLAPWWAICSLVIGFGASGIHYLGNDWFQVWLSYYLITMVVLYKVVKARESATLIER